MPLCKFCGTQGAYRRTTKAPEWRCRNCKEEWEDVYEVPTEDITGVSGLEEHDYPASPAGSSTIHIEQSFQDSQGYLASDQEQISYQLLMLLRRAGVILGYCLLGIVFLLGMGFLAWPEICIGSTVSGGSTCTPWVRHMLFGRSNSPNVVDMPTTPSLERLRQRADAQHIALNNGDWIGFHKFFRPAFQENCPVGEFAIAMETGIAELESVMGIEAELRATEVTVDGLKGFVTTQLLHKGGEPYDWGPGDEGDEVVPWMFIDGEWYSVDEATEECPSLGDELTTPSTEEQPGEHLEELFWVYVDSVGEVFDKAEINRELGFEDAKSVLEGFLFQQYDERLKRIESYGIDPFSTWPYCINAISGAMHQAAIELASTPEEAALHVSSVMDIIDGIETDSEPAREGFGQYDEQRCSAFENEKKELMGWPSK